MGADNIKIEKIGDYEFHTELVNPSVGFPMVMKLTQMFSTVAGGDLSKAFSSLSPKDIEEMTTIFAAHTKVKTPNGNLVPLKDFQQVLFAGKYDLMLKWLLFCVEANFGNFFGDLSGLANDLGARLQRMFGGQSSPIM